MIKEAGVMLVIKDGLILGVSRRHDPNKFGLPGGKKEDNETPMECAIRECYEETGVKVNSCELIYVRVELGDGKPTAVPYYSHCFYATDWEGVPTKSEEGTVEWITAALVTSPDGAFPDYNRCTLDKFKLMFPNVYIKGE